MTKPELSTGKSCKSCAHFIHLRYVRIKGKKSLQLGECNIRPVELKGLQKQRFGDDGCEKFKEAEKLRF